MLSNKTKNDLLTELEKNGNVSLSCAKIGMDKSTFYRWLKNKAFKKRAELAIDHGRETNCDIAESSLIVQVKKGRMDAIKYLLSHNSPRYKQRITDFNFNYNKIIPQVADKRTLEDLIAEDDRAQEKLAIDTAGSKSATDTPPIAPQENQTT